MALRCVRVCAAFACAEGSRFQMLSSAVRQREPDEAAAASRKVNVVHGPLGRGIDSRSFNYHLASRLTISRNALRR